MLNIARDAASAQCLGLFQRVLETASGEHGAQEETGVSRKRAKLDATRTAPQCAPARALRHVYTSQRFFIALDRSANLVGRVVQAQACETGLEHQNSVGIERDTGATLAAVCVGDALEFKIEPSDIDEIGQAVEVLDCAEKMWKLTAIVRRVS